MWEGDPAAVGEEEPPMPLPRMGAGPKLEWCGERLGGVVLEECLRKAEGRVLEP